jgi:hypothetical protein
MQMSDELASDEPMTAGRRGCPVLEGYNPMTPEELWDPYPNLQRARAEAPVFFSPEFGMWSVTRQEDSPSRASMRTRAPCDRRGRRSSSAETRGRHWCAR